MADERDPFRLNATRPVTTRPDLDPVRPVAPVRPRSEAAAAYDQVEHPPPLRTDAGHVLVAQVMSHPVHTLPVHATLGEAWDLMDLRDVRHVPIVDGHLLVGLLTRADIARRAATERPGWRADRVDRHMARGVVAAAPDESLREAAERMINSRHGGVPVVTAAGRPVGFLSARDVLKMLVRRAPLDLWA